MIGSVLNRDFTPFVTDSRPSRPPPNIAAQRRALLIELAGSAVGVGLAVALAGLALGASPVLYALMVGAATVVGLSRYVELMFRMAYLNRLPARDHGLLQLATFARRIGSAGAMAALAVAAILTVVS